MRAKVRAARPPEGLVALLKRSDSAFAESRELLVQSNELLEEHASLTSEHVALLTDLAALGRVFCTILEESVVVSLDAAPARRTEESLEGSDGSIRPAPVHLPPASRSARPSSRGRAAARES